MTSSNPNDTTFVIPPSQFIITLPSSVDKSECIPSFIFWYVGRLIGLLMVILSGVIFRSFKGYFCG